MCLFRYPNSSVYWYDFRYRGQRHRASTGTKDQQLAKRIERERRRELEEGFNGLKPLRKPRRLKELYDELLAKKKAHWTSKTFETVAESWKNLEPQFGRKFAHEISAADIGRFRESKLAKDISPFSINRHIGLLRCLLKRADVWHSLRKDYQPLPVDAQSGTALSFEEEERLLAATQISGSLCLRVVVLLALSTGMRYNEIRTLQWDQLHLNDASLLAGIKSRAGRMRRILLPPRAHAALVAWATRFPNRLPHHYVFCHEKYGKKDHLLREHIAYDADPERPMRSFNTAWRLARKKAKLGLRFHDLRHTVVTRLLEGGTPFNTVAVMMGWSAGNTVLMIRKYGHLFDKSWRKAITLLDGNRDENTGKEEAKKQPTSTAAPARGAGDSRQEEPEQSDAAAGDPSAKKGGSSEAA